MGLFDRFLKAERVPAGGNGNESELAEQDAARLLEEGMALEQQGLMEEALRRYDAAIRLVPGLARAHFNRGNIFLDRGDAGSALEAYAKAVEYKPDSAAVHYNIGNVYVALGGLEAAVTAYRQATALKPDFVGAELALAAALEELENFDGAIASYRRALKIQPDYAEVQFALANALKHLWRLDEAAAEYRRLLELDPGHVEACSNLGFVLHSLGHLEEAAASYRRALGLKSDLVEVHGNLGNVLKDLGQFDDAVASYRRVLEIEPDSAKAYNNLGSALNHLGRTDDALKSFRCALAIEPDFSVAHSNLLFCLSQSEAVDAQALFAEHCRFAEQFEAPLRANWPHHNNVRDPNRRLQIGFVSADFRRHAVATYIEPVLENLAAHPKLSLHAYYNYAAEDSVTQRLRGYLSHWHPIVGLSDEELAQKILEDGIDILIDLSSHTAMHRLLSFARKPAPVQVSWMGYPGTTGLKSMDYYLSDRFFLPSGELDHQFTEKIVRLPASAPFLPFDDAPPVSSLPALSNGYVTFGSFNRLDKLNRSIIALWSRLLRALPGARIVLGGMPISGENETLVDWFAREGVARERLSFYPKSSMKDYLELHRQVDVCLDTFPYNGGTTTLHALWMGVPTLSLVGSTAAGRSGAAILGQVRLEAFLTHSSEDFVQKGMSWSGNLKALSVIRAELRGRLAKSVVCQPAVVADGLEQALRIMWQRWCDGLPAASFEVSSQTIGIRTS